MFCTFDFMKVLSLFDGISCGQVALNRVGIKYDAYYASEIKPHAIKVAQYHYPNTTQLGCVRFVEPSRLPTIDLLLGGSPCKGISRLNQKQEGLGHDESVLFYEYVRIYKEIRKRNRGVKFLLENTHGNKKATDTITEIMGVKPISINSKLVSAQNRPRYYWTNIDFEGMPDDKGLDTNTLRMYIKQYQEMLRPCPENRVKWLGNDSGKKSVAKGYTKINPFPKYGCLTANGHKKWNENYKYINGKYYTLSQFELEWLQTLPPGYTDMLNYDDAYDVIGDGWTVDVIGHIFKGIK
jgi:site-specific DNA-cytosine methylase